jgi:hypothetical protein
MHPRVAQASDPRRDMQRFSVTGRRSCLARLDTPPSCSEDIRPHSFVQGYPLCSSRQDHALRVLDSLAVLTVLRERGLASREAGAVPARSECRAA